MLNLTLVNQVYPAWNESARMRARSALAFLPADFERVEIALEIGSEERNGLPCYCCKIKAKEMSGLWHLARSSDPDAHQALEHAIHVVVKSVLEHHVSNPLRRQRIETRKTQVGQPGG